MSSFLEQFVSVRKTPDWCNVLVMDDDLEAKANPYMELVQMPLDVREKFWSFASELIGESDAHSGVSSYACRLFERYCSNFVNMSPREWENAKKAITEKIYLRMAICIFLAYVTMLPLSKIFFILQGKRMKRTLRSRGHRFTIREIVQTEIDLLKGIKNIIPRWTNWQKAQMLADEVGLALSTVHSAGAIMDITDYNLPTIRDQYVKFLASGEQPTSSDGVGAEIRNAHIIASVVVASALYMEPQRLTRKLTITLGRWTRGSVNTLECLGQVIYKYVLDYVVNKERRG